MKFSFNLNFKNSIRISSILVFIILIFSSYKILKVEVSDVYFEGEIIYKIDYEAKKEYSEVLLKKYLGAKIVTIFKNGNSKRQYFSSDGTLLSTRYVDLEKLKFYGIQQNNDTIFSVNITINDTKFTFEALPDSVINGYDVRRIKGISTGSSNGIPFSTLGEYSFAKDLKINPEWFKDCKEGNYNEVAEYAKGILVEQIIHDIYGIKKETIEKVIKRKIKDEEVKLAISKNTIIKELK